MKRLILHIILIIFAVITLIPFIWMISASLMFDGHASVFPPRFIPDQFTLVQYSRLFERLSIAQNFINSFILSILVTVISLIFNSMAGYAFAKYKFNGKDKLFNLLISSMIIITFHRIWQKLSQVWQKKMCKNILQFDLLLIKVK